MSLSFEDAVQVWATEEFIKRGYDLNPGDTFWVKSTVIYQGSCETCGYETAGYSVMNNRTRQMLDLEVGFGDLIKELSRISAFANG